MAEHLADGVMLCFWGADNSLAQSARCNLGHVSLKLVGPSFRQVRATETYVSYWPVDLVSRRTVVPSLALGKLGVGWKGGGASRGYASDKLDEISSGARDLLWGGTEPLPGQKPVYRGEGPKPPVPDYRRGELLAEDDWQWGREAGLKIVLPARGGVGGHGLAAHAIQNWWRLFRGKRDLVWHLTELNCSTVVVAALKAGGAEYFVRPPKTALMRPAVVAEWARALAAKLATDTTAEDRTMDRRLPSLPAPGSLWTVAEWKARSTANRSFLGHSLGRIDKLLDAYHRTPKDPSTAFARRELLDDLLDALQPELVRRPDVRGEGAAVVLLAEQVQILRYRSA